MGRRSCSAQVSPTTRSTGRPRAARSGSFARFVRSAPVSAGVRQSEKVGMSSKNIGSGHSAANDEASLSCSFCGKTQRQARKLIAGPHVYICDECVELCNDILQEEWESAQVPDHALPSNESTIFKHSAICSLCRLPTTIGELLPIVERGFLCAACVEAVQNAAESSEP